MVEKEYDIRSHFTGEEAAMQRHVNIVLKDYYDIDETVDKDDKMVWSNVEDVSAEQGYKSDEEVQQEFDRHPQELPLMRVAQLRPCLNIEVTEEQIARHREVDSMNKDDKGKPSKDIPKYTRNTLLDFLYRRTNIACH